MARTAIANMLRMIINGVEIMVLLAIIFSCVNTTYVSLLPSSSSLSSYRGLDASPFPPNSDIGRHFYDRNGNLYLNIWAPSPLANFNFDVCFEPSAGTCASSGHANDSRPIRFFCVPSRTQVKIQELGFSHTSLESLATDTSNFQSSKISNDVALDNLRPPHTPGREALSFSALFGFLVNPVLQQGSWLQDVGYNQHIQPHVWLGLSLVLGATSLCAIRIGYLWFRFAKAQTKEQAQHQRMVAEIHRQIDRRQREAFEQKLQIANLHKELLAFHASSKIAALQGRAELAEFNAAIQDVRATNAECESKTQSDRANKAEAENSRQQHRLQNVSKEAVDQQTRAENAEASLQRESARASDSAAELAKESDRADKAEFDAASQLRRAVCAEADVAEHLLRVKAEETQRKKESQRADDGEAEATTHRQAAHHAEITAAQQQVRAENAESEASRQFGILQQAVNHLVNSQNRVRNLTASLNLANQNLVKVEARARKAEASLYNSTTEISTLETRAATAEKLHAEALEQLGVQKEKSFTTRAALGEGLTRDLALKAALRNEYARAENEKARADINRSLLLELEGVVQRQEDEISNHVSKMGIVQAQLEQHRQGFQRPSAAIQDIGLKADEENVLIINLLAQNAELRTVVRRQADEKSDLSQASAELLAKEGMITVGDTLTEDAVAESQADQASEDDQQKDISDKTSEESEDEELSEPRIAGTTSELQILEEQPEDESDGLTVLDSPEGSFFSMDLSETESEMSDAKEELDEVSEDDNRRELSDDRLIDYSPSDLSYEEIFQRAAELSERRPVLMPDLTFHGSDTSSPVLPLPVFQRNLAFGGLNTPSSTFTSFAFGSDSLNFETSSSSAGSRNTMMGFGGYTLPPTHKPAQIEDVAEPEVEKEVAKEPEADMEVVEEPEAKTEDIEASDVNRESEAAAKESEDNTWMEDTKSAPQPKNE